MNLQGNEYWLYTKTKSINMVTTICEFQSELLIQQWMNVEMYIQQLAFSSVHPKDEDANTSLRVFNFITLVCFFWFDASTHHSGRWAIDRVWWVVEKVPWTCSIWYCTFLLSLGTSWWCKYWSFRLMRFCLYCGRSFCYWRRLPHCCLSQLTQSSLSGRHRVLCVTYPKVRCLSQRFVLIILGFCNCCTYLVWLFSSRR
jgi:hypothetical protein